MIAGGGKVGLRLARQIQGQYQLKMIEPTRSAATTWPPSCPADVLVLQGDATDEDLLGDENVQDMDLFLRPDQRRRGQHHGLPAGQAHGRAAGAGPDQPPAYADLVQGTQIDIALARPTP
jgi:trk system potassium uptake protein TrkA